MKRVAGGALVATLAFGGLAAVEQVRADDAAATAVAERSARNDLARDLDEVRTAIADPARTGHNTASALLRHQLLVAAGGSPDPELGDRLVDQLRTAAATLEGAARTPLPDRPTIIPVAIVDPVFERLAGLERQAADLAERLDAAADEAAAWLAAVRDLESAARDYAASTDDLPAGSDPDAIAAAWRAESDRLAVYAEAIDAAAEHPASARLATAHAELVDGLGEVASTAIEQLEAGDLDAYNALIDDRLGGEDPFGFGAALTAARADVADLVIEGQLEHTRGRTLGLLNELEELRRTTPARLAERPA